MKLVKFTKLGHHTDGDIIFINPSTVIYINETNDNNTALKLTTDYIIVKESIQEVLEALEGTTDWEIPAEELLR